MARPDITPVYNDTVINKNFTVLRDILCGGISLDNFNMLVISGTTSGAKDSESRIIHSMSPRPIAWFPLVGDVYVQSIDSKFIDVRSTKEGVPFKIVLIGGSPVTGESISAAGVSQDVITTLSVQPMQVFGAAAENAGKNTLPGSNYVNVVNDASYFYLTVGGTATANGANLVRINKTTGVSDTITCGSVALSALCLQGTDLYVLPNVDTAGVVIMYIIDTLTFTLTASFNISSGNSPRITDAFVGGARLFYTSGTTGSQGAVIHSCNLDGSSHSVLNLATTVSLGNNSGGKKIISDGISLWVTEYDSASQATTNVYKVNVIAFTLTATYATPGGCYRMCNGVLDGTTIWYPAVSEQSGKTPTNITYGTVLIELDTLTGNLTVHPISGMGNSSKGSADLCFTRNIVRVDNFIYLFQCSANGEFGIRICEYNTDDNTQRVGWFAFAAAFPSVEYSMNNNMIQDSVTGELIIINNCSSSSGVPNFEYFKPSL